MVNRTLPAPVPGKDLPGGAVLLVVFAASAPIGMTFNILK
jgi:hypothetical protein